MVSILSRQPAAPGVYVMSPPPLYKDGVYAMNQARVRNSSKPYCPPLTHAMPQTVINTVLRRILPQVVAASSAQPVIIGKASSCHRPQTK
jgi:hypothetical protein